MIDSDVVLGADVRIFAPDLVNLFGCTIGDRTFVGPFVEITRGVIIGQRCLIGSHSFICDGVRIGNDVFVGHGVVFTNDLYPMTYRQVKRKETVVGDNASLGSNATIVGGVRIGEHAIIGAGAVVTKDVPNFAIAVGNPAGVTRRFDGLESLRAFIEARQDTALVSDALPKLQASASGLARVAVSQPIKARRRNR
jgi:UDP-2-acetamido-3-amino-2,3-dideoxy-glucuronate N-acetyltransferase